MRLAAQEQHPNKSADDHMIFPLVQDFADVLAAMPREHTRHRILKLLDEAIRRDVHFIDRHPTTFFQCLWNTCWWYDNREKTGAPYRVPDRLETWRSAKELATPGFRWIRSLRPPSLALAAGQGAVFRGHKGVVTSVTCSPDGQLIVSASNDQTIRIWTSRDSDLVACWRAHEKEVHYVSFSIDGHLLASSSADGTVAIWDVDSKQLMARLQVGNPAQCVAFAPDGGSIAVGTDRGEIRIWDLLRPEATTTIPWGIFDIKDLAFSPDGARLAACTCNEICVWETATHQRLAKFPAREGQNISWTPDGRWITTGPQIWEASTGREVMTLKGHEFEVFCSAFSRDGNRVATGSLFRVRVWDRATGKELAQFRGHEQLVYCVAWLPDGRAIVTGSEDGTVRLWPLTGEVAQQPEGDPWDKLLPPSISDNGRYLAMDKGNLLRILESDSGDELASIPMRNSIALRNSAGRIPGTSGLAISDSGDRAAALHNSGLQVWEISTRRELCHVSHAAMDMRVMSVPTQLADTESTGHPDTPTPANTQETKSRLMRGLSALPSGLRKGEAPKPRSPLRTRAVDTSAEFMSLSSDGKLVSLGTRSGLIQVRSAETGVIVTSFQAKSNHSYSLDDAIGGIQFSSDNLKLVALDTDLKMQVWKVADGSLEQVVDYGTGSAKLLGSCHLCEARVIDGWVAREVEHGLETSLVVGSKMSGIGSGELAVAWFPHVATHLIRAGNANVWVGTNRDQLCIFRLEGEQGPWQPRA